jgi:hypothetical protein
VPTFAEELHSAHFIDGLIGRAVGREICRTQSGNSAGKQLSNGQMESQKDGAEALTVRRMCQLGRVSRAGFYRDEFLSSYRFRVHLEWTEPALGRLDPHLLLLATLMAIEMPTMSLVSQPLGRFTDCNK